MIEARIIRGQIKTWNRIDALPGSLACNARYRGQYPLRTSSLLGYVDILPALYGRVIIPQTVFIELQHPHTPVVVRAWMANSPAWLEIRQTTSRADTILTEPAAGEWEAILLAQELNADLL
jgi:predicted nucleic acid-binding protein